MSIQDPSPHLAQQQQHQKCDKVRSENLTFFKFSKAIFHHIPKMLKSLHKRSKTNIIGSKSYEVFKR